jgi:hypothetical protein
VSQDGATGDKAVEGRLDSQLIPMDPPGGDSLGAVHRTFVPEEELQDLT